MSSTNTKPEVARAPGRPRDPEVDEKVRRAVLESLAAHGFSGLTIDKICVAAGVPRATFYRRWSTLNEAVADAFHEMFLFRDLTRTDDPLQDIVGFFMAMAALYNDPVMGPCMGLISHEGRLQADLGELIVDHFVERRTRNRAFVADALARLGRADVIDPDLMMDVMSGTAMNSYLVSRPVSRENAELIVRRLVLLV